MTRPTRLPRWLAPLLLLGCGSSSGLGPLANVDGALDDLAPAAEAGAPLDQGPPPDRAPPPGLGDPCPNDLACAAGTICQQGRCALPLRLTLAFSPPAQYPTCYQPARLAAADLDGDGRLDLVVLCGAASSYLVLPGLGDGTFGAGQAYQVASPDAQDLLVGDLDGDGKPDLVLGGAPRPNQGARVFLGRGDLTFGAGALTRLPDLDDRYAASADLDGDGHADLVLGNQAGGAAFTSLLGDGSGGFRALGSPGAARQLGVALGDLDGDGRLDALSSDEAGLGFRRGDGTGHFAAPSYSPLRQGGQRPLTLVDLDRDGVLDVLAGATDLLFGKGDGGFEAAMRLGGGEVQARAADLDRDGYTDVLWPEYLVGPATFEVRLGLGARGLAPPIDIPASRALDSAVGDFNGDSLPDLALLDSDHDFITLVLNRSH